MFEDLFQKHNLTGATHVLLTGDSAGGVGAMNNADWIGEVLRCAPALCPMLHQGQLHLQTTCPANPISKVCRVQSVSVIVIPMLGAVSDKCCNGLGKSEAFFAVQGHQIWSNTRPSLTPAGSWVLRPVRVSFLIA